MPIRSAALGMALLVAMLPAAFAEDQPPAQTEAAAPQWTEFQSPERGFAVSFPGTPKFASTPVDGQNPLVQYDFQVSVGDNTIYNVVVFEYPQGKGPNPDNDTYVRLVNAYAKGSDTRLRKRGEATIASYHGFEAISDDKKGQLSHLIDVIPSGDRIFMLVTAGPKGHATGDDAERFRDSFRLLGQSEPAPAPAQSAATPPAQ